MSEQGRPSDKELTTEEREDIRRSLLLLMGAPVPNRARIRESLRDLSQTGIDARAAYELWRNYRPEGFPSLPAFDLLMAEPDAQAEREWNYYNGTSKPERVTRYRDAVRAGMQIEGTAPGVQVIDFEGDSSAAVLSEMAESQADLANLITSAISSIATSGDIEMVFGGFTPAGTHLVLTYEGRTYVNQLAAHALAQGIADVDGSPYPETFSRLLLDIVIHEAATLGLSQKPERATPPVSPAPRTTHDSGPILCTSHDIEMWAYDGPYERAEDGNAEAQFEVGQMYHLGRGLKKDPVEAALWYGKAAEQGHAEAQLSLGRLCFLGAPAEPVPWQYANEDGSPSFTNALPRDLGEAATWLTRAADQGQVEARDLLEVVNAEVKSPS